ncbi:MAG: outer membrane beta-barrel protein [Alphaproteobacteria bacterium]|nr:outer membrane beta-barrel protein [Alphaproteobacteria bacterium]
MKKSLVFAVLALAGVGSAQAADMPVSPYYYKATRVPAVILDWTGLYLGLNGGYAGGQVEGVSAKGGTIGGQIGFRWQASNLVFGVEGQGNWAGFSDKWSIRKTTSEDKALGDLAAYQGLRNSTENYSAKTNAFAMVTGQIGYAANNLLVYIKGGAAVLNSRVDHDRSSVVTDTLSGPNYGKVLPQDTLLYFYDATGCLKARKFNSDYISVHSKAARWGGTLGVGAEYAVSQNWSVGAEYNHLFVNKTDMVLLRMNYRIGGPGMAGRY